MTDIHVDYEIFTMRADDEVFSIGDVYISPGRTSTPRAPLQGA